MRQDRATLAEYTRFLAGGADYLHEPDRVLRLAHADDTMHDGLLHYIKVGLRCAQAVCQSILGLPFLHETHKLSHPDCVQT